ncbi:TauD/TfdA family dioxygenase [Amycolatopsis aidingensis]|uniref:TauD/TfdA family dioxygenase n=1 Tax=Amycolatopsis aidingensis TaxID=2842453 RepID=UPI001C0C9085|nr:TauD/TfdA family dioxygenase [Amycolatopsis aidingensis]
MAEPEPATVAGHGLELAEGRPPLLALAGQRDPAEGERWVAEHRDRIIEAWSGYGALLLRGIGLAEPAGLERIAAALGVAITTEREPFAERADLGGGVYSSVTWSPDQPMCMHHENSYALEVPQRLLIGCLVPPVQGGVTGLADGHRVLSELPTGLVDRFAAEGWLFTRNYSELVGTSWQEAFGTDDREIVEKYCRANRIELEWLADGSLRTTQHRPAVIAHPRTGRRCWFNQIAFFNQWTLDQDVREYLTFEFGADGLPFDTRHADGSPIEQDVIDTINGVYEQVTMREPWQAGDLLLVDNIRMAHSREPYSGRRSMAMVFGDPATVTGVQAGPDE